MKQRRRVECPELVEGHYVYILLCDDKSYYVGYTCNIEKRLEAHRQQRASHWTAKRLPVELVYTERHVSQLTARRREKQLKGWTRSKKERLISGIWT